MSYLPLHMHFVIIIITVEQMCQSIRKCWCGQSPWHDFTCAVLCQYLFICLVDNHHHKFVEGINMIPQSHQTFTVAIQHTAESNWHNTYTCTMYTQFCCKYNFCIFFIINNFTLYDFITCMLWWNRQSLEYQYLQCMDCIYSECA